MLSFADSLNKPRPLLSFVCSYLFSFSRKLSFRVSYTNPRQLCNHTSPCKHIGFPRELFSMLIPVHNCCLPVSFLSNTFPRHTFLFPRFSLRYRTYPSAKPFFHSRRTFAITIPSRLNPVFLSIKNRGLPQRHPPCFRCFILRTESVLHRPCRSFPWPIVSSSRSKPLPGPRRPPGKRPLLCLPHHRANRRPPHPSASG